MPKVLDPMKKNEVMWWVGGLFVLVGGIYGYALFTAPTATSKAKNTTIQIPVTIVKPGTTSTAGINEPTSSVSTTSNSQ